MLGSDFFEDLVKKENTGAKAAAVTVGGGVVTLLLVAASFVLHLYLLMFGAIAAGVGTWFLNRNCHVEYEYVIAEQTLEITKIIAQSKRKPMISLTLDKAEAFGKLSEAPQLSPSATLVLACAAEDDRAYYMDLTHEMYGNVRLVMTPDDRFLTYFARHLPRTLQFCYTPQENPDA